MQAEAASSAVEDYDPSTQVLDVDFDSDEILGDTTAEVAEAAEAEALSEPEVEPTPRLKRARSVHSDIVKLAAPKAPRRRRVVAASASRGGSVGKPSSKEVVDAEPPVPNYLEVLKRGLEMARAAHRAERVARYDTFFRM